ncbi:hypothetical protein [Virgibacillus salexigens]|uniref:Uncharacterized protein n=1 Tax=Virgibacillus kapii TaxID=1638645 RepID=A0ABQ2D7I8_9BACI|nr:hypothetical protein [Virgibacillus kapii]GGJ48911.1 hypothetical protein GCM10007111_08720 [Virgibacillus kapii]
MNGLRIKTIDGEDALFKGKDAEKIYNSINNAGAKGAAWAGPIKLENGWSVTFVLSNIISMSTK